MHKFLKVKKLHFGETLKPAETQQSCNIAKFTLKAAGICEFFNVTAYLCVLYNRCLSFVAMFLEKYFSFFRLGQVRILFTWAQAVAMTGSEDLLESNGSTFW